MKVLIISHNPVSHRTNMGKTFLTLFSGFAKEELCQLYIYPAIPDGTYCGSYYRVTDKEALRALLHRGAIGGEVDQTLICPEQGQYENDRDRAVYRDPRNKSPLRRLARDGLWRRANWYHDGLRAWLDREDPTCVFVAPGAAGFLYDMAMTIAGERRIPIVTYLCDEFYFVKAPKRPLERLRLKRLKGKMEALLGASRHLVVISPELAEAYRVFGLPTTVLMTGAEIPAAEKPGGAEQPDTLCYFGNIRCNRHHSLGEVGRTLDAINGELGTAYRLKIYTAEQDERILAPLRAWDSVELAGFAAGAEYEKALTQAGLLLHAEAFDPDSVDRVKHSVSTKIADYLASGVPVVAYGPEGIASMAHLTRHDCALTAVSPEKLRETLLRAFTDPAERQSVAANGLKTAMECHDGKTVSHGLRRILL